MNNATKNIVEIREITAERADEVARTLRRGFRDVAERLGFTLERCPSFPAHITGERIREEFDEGTRFFAIGEGGEMGGCIGSIIKDGLFWMVRLAVIPERRHSGWGEALLQHGEREAWKHGFRRVDIAVVHENRPLCEWYQRLGYVIRETKKYDHLPYTLAYMVKEATNG